jgi:hypothetical protein
MPLTRRRLLQLCGLAAGAPLLGVSLWTGMFGRLGELGRRYWPGRREPPLPLADLDFDPAAVDAFEADYERHFGPLPDRELWSADVQTRFLLSTDFFRFDADASRRISYVGLYEPSVTPCNNPLARFD